MRWWVLPLLVLVLTTSCYPGGTPFEGLGEVNPEDNGPQIQWDIDAEPMPEIPFPNDVGTRVDATSPTGRRVNVRRGAPTQHERDLRGLIDDLDGFGTYAPIYVQFKGRIDIVSLHALQTDDDPTNDPIYLINVDPDSDNFGDQIPVDVGPGPYDLGKGRFPLGLERPAQYFPGDPRIGASNLLFDTIDEDVDGDGECSPEEDTDDDGVCDKPNLWGEVLQDDYARLDDYVAALTPFYGDGAEQKARQYADLITSYELETETLVFRPVLPLDEATTYAVVLTRQIVGEENGSPIRSPFKWVNHLQQTVALSPLVDDDLLGAVGTSVDEVAFAWSFTTQSVTLDIRKLRAGLYGEGPFERLAEEFEPYPSSVFQIENAPYAPDPNAEPLNLWVLKAERLMEALENDTVAEQLGFNRASLGPLFQSYRDFIDYFVFFSFESPAFIENDLGVFEVDSVSGEATYGRETIYVTCAVPKERGGHRQPFPVTFYSHGYTSSRFESLGFAGSLGRFGLATCSIDAYGHGLPRTELFEDIAEGVLAAYDLERMAEVLFISRARDLNNDGESDSGGDFWSANTFHTRDVVRQSMVDHYAAIRVMRNFGTGTMPIDVDDDSSLEVSGDFDGNGVADIGGEQGYSIFGQSLGGIMSGLVAPTEPLVTASAPTAGGGGLVQLALRSYQGGVVQAVYLPLFGPTIIGQPSATVPGRYDLKFYLLDVNDDVALRFATVPDPEADPVSRLRAGDRVRVTNLDNGEFDEVLLRGDAQTVNPFRLRVAADTFDRIRVDLSRDGVIYRTIDTFENKDFPEFQGYPYYTGDELKVLQEGFGFRRQSPSLRRLFTIAQMVIDPADPINYALAHAEPLDMAPEGEVPTNVLYVNTVGDMNVPIDTGVATARAARFWALDEVDARYGTSIDQALIDSWTVEGLEDLYRFTTDPCHYDDQRVLFDVDYTAQGEDPNPGPAFPALAINPACDGSASTPDWCANGCSPTEPLRVTVSNSWGKSGMRIPYVSRHGKHGFEVPLAACHVLEASDCFEAENCGWDAAAETCNYTAFDYNLFQINQIGRYFVTEGRDLVDDPCLASYLEPCSFF